MLNKELKKISGSVLGIGLDEKAQNILDKNKNVVECFLLNSNSTGNSKTKGRTKTINIKKIRKTFRKKSFDYIIGNFEELKPYLRSFIKNSIYLNKGKIYFYNITDFELEELENRYKRYNSKIDISKDLAIIDNSNAKTNILKNIIYYTRDLTYDIIDYIGKILVN